MYEYTPSNTYIFENWLETWFPRYLDGPGSNFDAFIVFAIAADLKALIEYELKPDYWVDSDKHKGYLMRVAATGERLSSSLSSRESMVRHLIKLGCPVDTPVIYWSDIDYKTNCTLLSWLLRNKRHRRISENDALSLAIILLENGASTQAPAFYDPALQGRRRTVLYSCILHNNVKAVELLLPYGPYYSYISYENYISVLDQELVFTVFMRERHWGEGTMSDILRKDGLFGNWMKLFPEEPSITMAILHSGFSTSIGNSQVGESVAWALQKTWGDTGLSSIVNHM